MITRLGARGARDGEALQHVLTIRASREGPRCAVPRAAKCRLGALSERVVVALAAPDSLMPLSRFKCDEEAELFGAAINEIVGAEGGSPD